VGEGGHGSAIVVDHALPDEGRQESGPRPMELLLIGLAGCTSMDVVSVLQKKRQPLTGLQTKVTAERAAEHPKVYTQIHVEYVVTGRGVKPAAVERAIELSVTKYCSAMEMLRQAAEITTSFQVVEE
jgi:putative redox protein